MSSAFQVRWKQNYKPETNFRWSFQNGVEFDVDEFGYDFINIALETTFGFVKYLIW